MEQHFIENSFGVYNDMGEKLYSREEDIAKLVDAYETREKRHLVLLVGQAGNGKTSLATTIRSRVEDIDDGYFLTGRFDTLEHPEPFAPFLHAITQFVERLLLSGCESELARVRNALSRAMDMSEIHALERIIPKLGYLFPSQPQLKRSGSSGALDNQTHHHGGRHSFLVTFCNFMRSISHPDHPIVLFLDDLQSSDAGSLEVLKILVADRKIQGLLCAVAFRPVGVRHPFSLLLRNLESAGVQFIPILPSPISEDAVLDWLLSYDFGLPKEQCKSMAAAICDGTKGNAFSVNLCLKLMDRNRDIVRETGGTPLQGGGDVKSLFKVLFQLLSPGCQKVCWVASCMGMIIDSKRLGKIFTDDLSEPLSEAERFGLIVYEKKSNLGKEEEPIKISSALKDCIIADERDLTAGYYRFTNSTIKDCTYNLISSEDKKIQHTAIGNIFRMEVDAVGIYRVVAHLRLGVELLSPKGKEAFARLCLQAGEDTSQWTEFTASTKYLDLGISLLDPKQKWKSQYALSLALYSASADVYNCTGKFAEMDLRLLEVLENAKDSIDKLQAYTIQMQSLSARTQHGDAIALALKVLPKLGEPIAARKAKGTVESEVKAVRKLLEIYQSEQNFLNLHRMKEKKKLGAMKILNLLLASSMTGQGDLVPWVACRMVRVTIQHGLTGTSAVGLAAFGSVLCSDGDIETGTWCSSLALDVMEHVKEKFCKGRVMAIHWGIVSRFKKPWKQCQEPLKVAYRLCMEGGDNEFALISPILSILNMLVAGGPLSSIAEALKSVYQLLYKKNQDTLMRIIRPFFQEILNLMGATTETNPEVLSGNIMNEEEDLRHAQENFDIKIVFCIYLCQTELAFLLHKFGRARELIEKCNDLGATDMIVSSLAIKRVFLDAMTSVGVAWEISREKDNHPKEKAKRRKKYLVAAKECLDVLKNLTKYAPENVQQKAFLVEAEIKALEGFVDEAIVLFKRSMEHAEQYGAIADRALACERTGLALRVCGREDDALDYLEDCCGYYRQWGALVKVNHVKGNVIPQAIFEWDE